LDIEIIFINLVLHQQPLPTYYNGNNNSNTPPPTTATTTSLSSKTTNNNNSSILLSTATVTVSPTLPSLYQQSYWLDCARERERESELIQFELWYVNFACLRQTRGYSLRKSARDEMQVATAQVTTLALEVVVLR
jgi:hypothetical protein